MEEEPNPEVLAYARAVGFTLHNWSMVEIQMGRLFVTLAEMSDDRKADALTDVVRSFDVRLDMTSTLMGFETLDDVGKVMWRKMKDMLKAAYSHRHKVAHFTMLADTNSDGEDSIRFYPFLSAYKIKEQSGQALSIAEIHRISDETRGLVAALDWFLDEARLRRGLPLTQTQPEPQLVAHLRGLAEKSLAERARLQKSKPV